MKKVTGAGQSIFAGIGACHLFDIFLQIYMNCVMLSLSNARACLPVSYRMRIISCRVPALSKLPGEFVKRGIGGDD